MKEKRIGVHFIVHNISGVEGCVETSGWGLR